jgi:hypothetical protein
MTSFQSFVGIDIASTSFMACVGKAPWKLTVKPMKFDNQEDGFASFLGWLQDHNLWPERTVVCMEATGVYGEGLAYFLHASGYTVAVEPPLNIQRKFPANASKTDELDCQYIAEYACRYVDKLSFWQPRADILEQVKVLLTTRQHFSVQLTGHKNALHAVNRKKVSSELAKQAHQSMIEQITKQVKAIDQEIRRLIDSDPTFKQTLLLLLSVPGIGLQLAAHLLIHMQTTLDPKLTRKCWPPSSASVQSSTRVALLSFQHQRLVTMVRPFCENCSTWPLAPFEHTKSRSNSISFVKLQKASTKNWSLTTFRTNSSRLLVLSSALKNHSFQTMSLSTPSFFKIP